MDQVDIAQQDFVEAAPRFTLYQTPPRGLTKLANSPPSSPSSGRKVGLFANESYSRHSPLRGPVTSMSQLSPNKRLQFTPIIYRGASEMHRVVYDDSDEEEEGESYGLAWEAKMPTQQLKASAGHSSSNFSHAENSFFGPSVPSEKARESHLSKTSSFKAENNARQREMQPNPDGVSPSGSSDDVLEVSSPPLDPEATLNERNGGISSVSTSRDGDDESTWGDEVAAAFGSEDTTAKETREEAKEFKDNLQSDSRRNLSATAGIESGENAVEMVQKPQFGEEAPHVDSCHAPSLDEQSTRDYTADASEQAKIDKSEGFAEDSSLKAQSMNCGSNKSAAIALNDHEEEKPDEDIYERAHMEEQQHAKASHALTPEPQSEHDRATAGIEEEKVSPLGVRTAWEEPAEEVKSGAQSEAVEAPASAKGAETPPTPRLLSSKTQLGDEWRATVDGRGRRYYYNRRTRETTWVAPAHLVKVETPEGGFRLYTLTQEDQPSLASPSKPPPEACNKPQGPQEVKSLLSTPLRTRTEPQRTLRGLREALRGTNRRTAIAAATPQRTPLTPSNTLESAPTGYCPGCASHVDLFSHLPLCEPSRRMKGTAAARALGKFFGSDSNEAASPSRQQSTPQRRQEQTPAKAKSSSPNKEASKTQPLVTPMRKQTRPPRAPQPAEAGHGKLLWSPPPRKALSGRTVLRGGSQATALYIP